MRMLDDSRQQMKKRKSKSVMYYKSFNAMFAVCFPKQLGLNDKDLRNVTAAMQTAIVTSTHCKTVEWLSLIQPRRKKLIVGCNHNSRFVVSVEYVVLETICCTFVIVSVFGKKYFFRKGLTKRAGNCEKDNFRIMFFFSIKDCEHT